MNTSEREPIGADTSLLQPDKRTLATAPIFMILTPTLLLSFVPVGRAVISPQTRWAIPTALGLFIAGWLLAGAALRILGSASRGAAAAALIYLMIGFIWVIGYNTVGGVTTSVLIRFPANILAGALAWPYGVAGSIGLFGLDIGG